MFEDSNQTSVTVDADTRNGGYILTVGALGERVTLGVRYRTEEDARRAGEAFVAEWVRTGRKPRGVS
jgi:hypothetical protein